MKILLFALFIIMSSCVSVSYHQRKINDIYDNMEKSVNACVEAREKDIRKWNIDKKELIERLRKFNQVDKNGELIRK